MKTGDSILTLRGHSDLVSCLLLTSDGNLISASDDCTLKIWDLTRGKEIRTLYGHTDSISAISVSSDGSYLISASYDKTLRIWDIMTGKVIAIFYADNMLNSCAISPDGMKIVAGAGMGHVYFLEMVRMNC